MKRIHYGLGAAAMAAVLVQLGCSQTAPVQTGASDKSSVETAAWGGPSGPIGGMKPTVPLGDMGNPVPGLTQPQLARFEHGKAVYTRDFRLPPDGVSNASSCVACHGGGGAGGASDKFAQNYIDIQDPYTEAGLQAGDNLGNLGLVGHILGNPTIQPQPTPRAGYTLILSKRLATMTAGTGYLAAIPEAQIYARAQQQATHLGISGEVRFGLGSTKIGRYGWKNRTDSIAGFNAGAHVNELGISSPDFPFLTHWNLALFPAGLRPDPNFNPATGTGTTLSRQEKKDMDVFTSLTIAPKPLRQEMAGYAAFKKAGCAECHWDGYTTTYDANDLPAELKEFIGVLGGGKRVPAYTDMLAHNMGVGKLENVTDQLGRPALASYDGEGLADGVVEGAKSDEYRTAPLWGLRFKTKFLHNGSASTIDEAVRRHYYDSPYDQYDSEANQVVLNYLGKNYKNKGNLNPWERAALSRFLRTL